MTLRKHLALSIWQYIITDSYLSYALDPPEIQSFEYPNELCTTVCITLIDYMKHANTCQECPRAVYSVILPRSLREADVIPARHDICFFVRGNVPDALWKASWH